MKKVKHFIQKEKLLSLIIIVLVLITGYYIYSKYSSSSTKPTYLSAKAEMRDITTTISGTGQVYASSQVDIKSKVSGDIIYLNTQANGTQIQKGTLIAKIDSRDAEIALENARIAYNKLVKPADNATLSQAGSALSDAIATNLKSYEDGFNSITNFVVDLPTIINGLNSTIYDRTGYLQLENVRPYGQIAIDYQIKASNSFDSLKSKYEIYLNKYKSLSINSASTTIESYLDDAYLLSRNVAEVIKNTQNAVEFVRKQRNDTNGDTTASNLATWTSTINSDSTSLLTAKTSISSSLQSIRQKNLDLDKVVTGADELDIRSQQLNLRQKEYDYQNYFIRAPFDGVLARLTVKDTDTVSSGTIIGTLVSSQKISSITLNEVDVAKVKVGQKVKLTFDAIDGLTIDGTVSTVDLVGTVSQGVVNYNVEITHDTQDDRIKSGMSVSASIIVDKKENVLAVPNSAIKTLGRANYVEMYISSTTPPVQRNVKIGISNENLTEILSGLNVGDKVVTRTISSVAKATTAPTIFGGAAGNRTNSSQVRIPRN